MSDQPSYIVLVVLGVCQFAMLVALLFYHKSLRRSVKRMQKDIDLIHKPPKWPIPGSTENWPNMSETIKEKTPE